MRHRPVILLICAILLPIVLLIHFRQKPDVYEMILLARLSVHPGGSTVIMGDSIVQGSDINSACGPDAVNAGIGSTTAHDAFRLARRLLPVLRPAHVIVATGINDALWYRQRSAARFQADYRALLDRIGPRLSAVVEVNPVEPGRLSVMVDPSFIPRQNAIIRSEAARRHVPVVPAPASVAGLTQDGVHPNEPGKRAWLERLRTVCR